VFTQRRRAVRFGVIAAAISIVLTSAVSATAHDEEPPRSSDGAIDNPDASHDHHQHGGTEGHLPASSENVDVVGSLRLTKDEGRIADVGFHDGYAYLAAFWEPRCKKSGVYVVDATDPQNPKELKFIRTSKGSYVGEGVHVIPIETEAFSGDLLAFNNEICDPSSKRANGGMTLVDVSNPKKPEVLAEHVGDVDETGRANEIHSVFLWQDGDAAYAVLVDNEETTDVDIMDITDPRNPELIAEYDLAAEFPQILQEDVGLDSVFLHDMIVKEIDGRQIMLLSYWDGGYVTMDVTDPTDASYIGDTDFTFPDPEAAKHGHDVDPGGNAHQAEFTLDDQYILAADENFSPIRARSVNTTKDTEFATLPGSDTPSVDRDEPLEAETVFGGRACDDDPAVPAATEEGQIAVVERGVCPFTEKVANVEEAGGYAAVIVFNSEGAGNCDSLLNMAAEGGIPAMFAGRGDAYDLFDSDYDPEACAEGVDQAPIELGATGDGVRFEAFFAGWGYVHLYRNEPGKMTELDTYAVPEAMDPDYAEGFGDLSVHEVATSHVAEDLAYFSYYAAGFRVTRIVDEQIQEVGHFIDEGGSNFWGVEVFEHEGREYVAASDRDFGLYIFEYTGP
jgi:hypothetical protein